jgi:hypothetical protein
VLASPQTERWIVSLTDLRSAPPGYGFGTPDDWVISKLPQVPAAEQSGWVQAHADFIFWGSAERAVLGPPPGSLVTVAAAGGSSLLRSG